MDNLRKDIEKLLPSEVYLMDLNEDPHKKIVRCFVDSEHSITLEETTEIAKIITDSGILDTYYPEGAAMEVTSLGISEPLTRSFQYKKNTGRMLNLTYNKNGRRKFTEAELVGYNDDILYLKNNNKGQFQLSLDHIYQAKVIVQFN